MENYYVYAYLDPKSPSQSTFCDILFENTPIYIGKGKNKRMYDHLKDRKRFKTLFYNKLNKMISNHVNPLIIKLKSFENESEAIEFEKLLISEIKNIKSGGTLYNSTDGGEGIPGYKFTEEKRKKIRNRCILEKSHLRFPDTKGENHPMYGKKHTEETRKKLSTKRRNRITTEETKKKMSDSHKGKKLSEDHKRKLSESNKGVKRKQETKDRISSAKKGCKPWNYDTLKKIILQIDKDGKIVKEWNSLIEIEENGYQKSNVINVCCGKRKSHKGYYWRYKSNE